MKQNGNKSKWNENNARVWQQTQNAFSQSVLYGDPLWIPYEKTAYFYIQKIGTESKSTCPLRPTLIFLYTSLSEYQRKVGHQPYPKVRDFHTNYTKLLEGSIFSCHFFIILTRLAWSCTMWIIKFNLHEILATTLSIWLLKSRQCLSNFAYFGLNYLVSFTGLWRLNQVFTKFAFNLLFSVTFFCVFSEG